MAHIGIDARLTYYTQGGIAQYTQHLIRELAALGTTDSYLILQSRKDSRTLASGPVQQTARCWTPAHHRYERLALAAELAPHHFDLLHSPDFIPPLGGRYRSVITIHDLAFLLYPQFMTAVSQRYYIGQIGAAVERADHIIAVSNSTRDDLIERLEVAEEKITVIYEAASERFHPQPPDIVAQFKAKYHLPDTYILFVGTYEPRKNLDGLLKAYAQLLDEWPDTPPLVAAGARGWFYEGLFALCEDMGLSDQVTWAEDIPFEDFPALYSGAGAFCLPSHYEGFGLPPLEAMACGTPVVVSDRGALPEIVGEAAQLIDPDNPSSIAIGLRRVLSDSALAANLRKRGLERAAQFSWRKAAEETLAVYHRTLEKA